MTEQLCRDVAEAFGLKVLKRITTGNPSRHFATFELSGPLEPVRRAWERVYALASADEIRGRFVYMRSSDIDWQPYIGIESVWCDLTPRE